MALVADPICTPAGESGFQAGDAAAQPEYYGLLAAHANLRSGRFVPDSSDCLWPTAEHHDMGHPQLTRHSQDRNRQLCHTRALTAQTVAISTSGYTATEETLSAPSIGASSGMTLGGAAVTSSGQWSPKLARLLHTRVIVRPTSAVIVTLSPMRSHG